MTKLLNNIKIKELHLIYLFLLTYMVIQPSYKFFEYTKGAPHINISIIILLLFSIFVLIVLPNIGTFKLNSIILIGFGILFLITMIQVISSPWAIHYGREGFTTYLKIISKTIFSYWMFWFSGLYLHKIIKKNFIIKILNWIWFLSSILIISNALSNLTTFSLILDGYAIYLMMADNYAIISIFVIVFASKRQRLLFQILSAVTLFALLSRASFYFFIFIIFLDLFKKNRLFFILILLSSAIFLFENYYNFKSNRMLRVVSGMDKSKMIRQELLENGINQLKSDWVLGNFMSEVEYYDGKTGFYIHNYLSFWKQFGIVPFFLLIIMIIVNYSKLFLKWILGRDNDNYFLFLFYFTTFVILEITFARSYQHPFIWISISAIPVYFSLKLKTNYE